MPDSWSYSVCDQDREGDTGRAGRGGEGWGVKQAAYLCLFIQFRASNQGVLLPTFKWVFPLQINLSGTPNTHTHPGIPRTKTSHHIHHVT